MRTIAYLSQVLVTDDTIAELVIEYARSLAVHDTSDTIVIPTVQADGTVSTVELLIGPASQMMSGESHVSSASLDPASTIEMLRARIGRLTPDNVTPAVSESHVWDNAGFDE